MKLAVCFYAFSALSDYVCLALLNDPATAYHHVTVIHDHGLTLGDGPLGLVEFDVQSVGVRLGHSGPLLRVVVANACLHAAGLSDALAIDKVDIRGCEAGGEELCIGGQHHFVRLDINMLHVHGLGQSQT